MQGWQVLCPPGKREPLAEAHILKMRMWEFLLWLSWFRPCQSAHEDVGSIPSLAHWVKDPTLLQAVAYAADVARIHCVPGCVEGLQLQL